MDSNGTQEDGVWHNSVENSIYSYSPTIPPFCHISHNSFYYKAIPAQLDNLKWTKFRDTSLKVFGKQSCQSFSCSQRCIFDNLPFSSFLTAIMAINSINFHPHYLHIRLHSLSLRHISSYNTLFPSPTFSLRPISSHNTLLSLPTLPPPHHLIRKHTQFYTNSKLPQVLQDLQHPIKNLQSHLPQKLLTIQSDTSQHQPFPIPYSQNIYGCSNNLPHSQHDKSYKYWSLKYQYFFLLSQPLHSLNLLFLLRFFMRSLRKYARFDRCLQKINSDAINGKQTNLYTSHHSNPHLPTYFCPIQLYICLQIYVYCLEYQLSF